MSDISNGVNCEFGVRVSIDETTPFEIKYLRHQLDFSIDELGDQIDNSTEPVDTLGASEKLVLGDVIVDGKARSIQYCLQQRYLGNCALRCRHAHRVRELINKIKN